MSNEDRPDALPPLRAIQVFEAVARWGGVSRAARELGVSPGAVSQQIRSLEAALQVKLLERDGRGVTLTSLGRRFLPSVTAAFDALRGGKALMARARQEREVVVSALPSVVVSWLGAALAEWSTLHPQVPVRVLASDAEPVIEDSEVDFRLTYGGQARAYPHFAEVFTDVVTPVAAPDLLCGRVLARPVEVLDFPLIGIDWRPDAISPPSWTDWLAAFAGSPPVRPGISFSLSSAAIEVAVRGRGLVLAQRSMIAAEVAAGRLITPFPAMTLGLPSAYFLAWSSSALSKPSCRALRPWLIRECRRRGDWRSH